jgi:cell division initiation protein
MERLTPLDLEAARFPIVRKGYDKDSVDALLRSVAAELGSLIREAQELRARHEQDLKELESFRSRESTLADALVLAQRTADETRALAHKEADLILEHARRQAEDYRRAAQDELGDLERKIEQRAQDRKNFESRFRSMLTDYLRVLDEAPDRRARERDAAVGE